MDKGGRGWEVGGCTGVDVGVDVCVVGCWCFGEVGPKSCLEYGGTGLKEPKVPHDRYLSCEQIAWSAA
eukprot:2447351-Alexandrium_andersonii.AAC.1